MAISERDWLKYAEQIAGQPLKEYEVGYTVEDVKERQRKKARGEPVEIAGQTIVFPSSTKEAPVQPVLAGVSGMSMASVSSWLGEWYKDMMRGLDVLLPEELLGIDITPTARVGGEKKGRVFYDDVWVEDGKVKVIRNGNLRVLGYTPQEAKKRFKTKRRRKRLTKRDIYIIEALKDGASPAAIALL